VNATNVYDGEANIKVPVDLPEFYDVTLSLLRINISQVNHPKMGAIKNDLRSNLYTNLDIQWMGGGG
jgi:hypothetical protein